MLLYVQHNSAAVQNSKKIIKNEWYYTELCVELRNYGRRRKKATNLEERVTDKPLYHIVSIFTEKQKLIESKN